MNKVFCEEVFLWWKRWLVRRHWRIGFYLDFRIAGERKVDPRYGWAITAHDRRRN